MLQTKTIKNTRALVWDKLCAYWTLVKSLQTGLLVLTGLAGYMSGRPAATWEQIIGLLGSLFLAVSGSTVLNMVIDRDIDAQMARTAQRPLPAGHIGVEEGLVLGVGMALCGTAWAGHIAPLYGLVVCTGLLFDVVIYTLWLKRRTPWSIIWGGIAGGMPVLAGRVLAVGHIDAVGLWLVLAVLLWIPTHIMTFSIKYAQDYQKAGVPVFPNTYGVPATRLIIGLSTGSAVVVMLWAMYILNLNTTLMWIARGLGGLLFGFTVIAMGHTTSRLTYLLYKLASLYMLGSMLVLILGA